MKLNTWAGFQGDWIVYLQFFFIISEPHSFWLYSPLGEQLFNTNMTILDITTNYTPYSIMGSFFKWGKLWKYL